jgi:hypothetical protein
VLSISAQPKSSLLSTEKERVKRRNEREAARGPGQQKARPERKKRKKRRKEKKNKEMGL